MPATSPLLSRLLYPTSVYRVTGDSGPLRKAMREVVREERFKTAAGLIGLPDFFRTAKEAGLVTPTVQRWQERVESRGVHFFDLPSCPRP